MKNLYLVLVLALLLLTNACGGGAERSIVLMTYNVGAFGKELDDSAPMISAMICELGAETVALNELDSCNRRHDIDQVRHLVDCLNAVSADTKGGKAVWDGRFGRAMAFAGGAYGNGVVTRQKIKDHFNIALPKEEGSEPRVCVVVETPDYVYAACHLDHIGEAARQEQARVMTEELLRRYADSRKPVFLAGDFNDTPDSPVIRQLSRDWVLLSPLADSYSALDPHVCIDYIFLLRNLASVRVLRSEGDATTFSDITSGDVKLASDHLPVAIRVAFRR